MEAIRAHLKDVKVPGLGDKVYKTQCVFSFDDPFSDDGLYVNLKTFKGFGRDYVELDRQRTGACLYLNIKAVRTPKAKPACDDVAPRKLGIGIEGGFHDDGEFDVTTSYRICVLPAFEYVAYPNASLPMIVEQSVAAIIAHVSAHRDQVVAQWEEEIKESKYADTLVQEPCLAPISSNPKDWQCMETGVKENLWLNLSTGHIGSGRQFYDGSGGNGAALRHYQAMKGEGKEAPLVVKLGTISGRGADVYSYAADEDSTVTDAHLATHLAHWGINCMELEKTEKSTTEMSIDLNNSYEWDSITADGQQLAPLYGPGFIGLKNLGNSCYMNSFLQMLCAIPEVADRYVKAASRVFTSAPTDNEGDVLAEFAKLAVGLTTNRYVDEVDVAEASAKSSFVDPHSIKTVFGKGHIEFSTGEQQDVALYVRHLLDRLSAAEREGFVTRAGAEAGPGHSTTQDLFQFRLEERTQCIASGKVCYKTATESILILNVQPRDDEKPAAKRQKTEDNTQWREVAVSDCLDRMLAPEHVPDYYSGATRTKGPAHRQTRLATFPKYLLVQVQKFYMAADWTMNKYEVRVDMPDTLDISGARGYGIQAGEDGMPEEDDTGISAATAQPRHEETADESLVEQLSAMGFNSNGCRRACLATKNQGVEAAMEWVLQHMGDADFADPPPTSVGSATGGAAPASVDMDKVANLEAMGFTADQAQLALKTCGGNCEAAVEFLFSHTDDIADLIRADKAAAADQGKHQAPLGEPNYDDGAGPYELMGFVSHMGRNTTCGHYVAHVKKNGKWAIFNDRKVAEWEGSVPKDLGYLYLYRRMD